jgi:hypothetical protein
MSNLGQRGTWDTPKGTHHGTTPHGGATKARPRRGMVWGPLALHLPLHQPLHFLSQNISTPLLKPKFLLFLLAISICLLNPSLLLTFGAFVLRYVTPSIVQVEFCLLEYFLSILAL